MTMSGGRLATAVDKLGLGGRPVVVHASLRSFGAALDGGADGLLDVLLSRGCTVVVPTFTEPQFGVAAPVSMRPARNGLDYANLSGMSWADPHGGYYTPECGLINRGMGTFPATVIARPAARRGAHPLNSFAAIGPRAVEIITSQHAGDVYGPIRKLAEGGGTVLLIGVGFNRMTALHLAEQRAGRRLFLRWARDPSGRTVAVEVGSCSEGFPNLEPCLRPHESSVTVGASRWRAYPAERALSVAAAAMAAEPSVTHCADTGCLRCADSIAGGPLDTEIVG